MHFGDELTRSFIGIHDNVDNRIDENNDNDVRRKQLRHLLPIGSSVSSTSAPDDARQSHLKIKNSKDRLEAKPIEYGFLPMCRDGVEDDLTGRDFPEELVKIGMTKELEDFKSKGTVGHCDHRRVQTPDGASPNQCRVGLHAQTKSTAES